MYNLANAIKNKGQNNITRKLRNKVDQMIYQPIFSKIVEISICIFQNHSEKTCQKRNKH